MVHQHLDNVLKLVRLCRAEESFRNLIHSLFQFWNAVIILHGIVSGNKQTSNKLNKTI